MDLALAIGSSVGVSAILIAVIAFVGRRNRLVRQLGFPLYVAALAAGLKVLSLFEVVHSEAVDRALLLGLVFLVAVAVLRTLGLFFFEVFLHSARGYRLPPLLPKVVMGAAYLITALIILTRAGVDMGPILATSAITSLVLGLALQPILGNFFAGVVISLERPFRINDWINYQGTEARVVAINWRTTHLRTRDNDNLVVPNRSIANEEVINYYYPHPLHMERIYVGVHYRTPPYRVKQALLDAVGGVDSVLKKPSPSVFLFEFGDSAIVYEIRIWIEDFANKPTIASHVRSEIWEVFRRRGITIPFPIRTLEIEPRARQLEIVRSARGRFEEGEEKAYPARLFVARGPDHGASLALTGEPVVVGRSSGSDLVLTEPQASKLHLHVEWRAEGYVLTDQESKFGTRVNDRDVNEQLLRDYDRILIGDTVIVFEPNVH